jgi:uncharacterized protein
VSAAVSEVRSDGKETFVQDGWLRANERKLATGTNNLLDQKSTLLEPIPSMRPSDVAPMPKDRFVELVIPLTSRGTPTARGRASA